MPCIRCHRGKLRRTHMCVACVVAETEMLKHYYASVTFTQPAAPAFISKMPPYPDQTPETMADKF